jgi:hypothetical protein
MDLLIVKWLHKKFQNEGQHTITGSRTPPNEPEALVFHMTTWSETFIVLASAAQEAFKSDFTKYGQSLTHPSLPELDHSRIDTRMLMIINNFNIWQPPVAKHWPITLCLLTTTTPFP